MSTVELLELFGIGLGSGALGTLLGVGGGVVLVPALALVLGVPLRLAVPASLVCIVATSVAGSIVHLRRHRVAIRLAVDLEWFTVMGAVTGGLVAALVPSGPLFFLFALMVAATAVRLWPRKTPAQEDAEAAARPMRMGAARVASVGAGLVSSLLGVGGGIFKVPIMKLLLGLPFDRAAATSTYMIGITTAAGALVYIVRGDVHYGITATTMLGTLVGSAGAAAVGHRVNNRLLQQAFAVLLLYVAIQMVRRGITGV